MTEERKPQAPDPAPKQPIAPEMAPAEPAPAKEDAEAAKLMDAAFGTFGERR